ncbi:hypothetical protein TIFTF001_054830 [Ficus carica]|uniref:Uncharacterized protein n=1 Tax=Ficus carica TaxID=3494 RepID=A0AA88EE56_FICCA|nr:hypothetical protein TIFTF001_054830 [Ficus carica]
MVGGTYVLHVRYNLFQIRAQKLIPSFTPTVHLLLTVLAFTFQPLRLGFGLSTLGSSLVVALGERDLGGQLPFVSGRAWRGEFGSI